MQEVSEYKINGAEIKRAKNGLLILVFSSKTISDAQLNELKEIKEDFFLVFYGCNLSRSNIDVLICLGVMEIGIFHSSFCDADFIVLVQSKNLRYVKLHDTSVTLACVEEIKRLRLDLKVFF
ncbi:hypothetical protein DWB84_14575 [Saccharophagus sp. K07]|uniref:hypothetical protein n=1 Tax=Saccharophagus sp. K07 TaxID=2283636 RepID=UPI001652450B|nr:hypothetical protein [Saccharophagus sp. K07]MBC6906675.1 hypothetical protein [Saccharophagus sp. K07]